MIKGIKLILVVAVCAAAYLGAGAGEKQRVVAVYEFGCIVEIRKVNETRIEIPVDEDGREHREQGLIIHAGVTLPDQGKGGTPATCAMVKIVH